MAEKRLTVGEIEVTVRGFFTTHHTFETEAGILGEFTFPAFSQYAKYQARSGHELLMQKTHWLGTAHQLVEGDVVRGTADGVGLLRQDLAIQFEGRAYSLQPKGLFNQAWVLLDEQGSSLVEVQPRGAFKQGAFVTILGAVDADLVAFTYYLVNTRWQEAAAVAACTASAAAS
jgi:hypothetical protein